MSGATRGGVSVAKLAEDVPAIEAAPGVVIRHLVGQAVMVRLAELDAGACVTIGEPQQEHMVVVHTGAVRIDQGERSWGVGVDEAAMIRPGGDVTLTAVGEGPARCQLASSPPDIALVRHLLHLEHADHGFD
ncbi:hypothetical protein RB608_23735 [Nocardioides sp. LHD-245]|uniref:hypothetical protein n=1 Tax=Nocardioides sp. LHD-245 TaxID=3051387 RepID=UPI0027E0C9B5|nr:hypothetical protein [Nocardioides sp. LHD-245]